MKFVRGAKCGGFTLSTDKFSLEEIQFLGAKCGRALVYVGVKCGGLLIFVGVKCVGALVYVGM